MTCTKKILIIILSLIALKVVIQEFFDDRLIEFESYKIPLEFENIMRARFPNGTNLNEAVNILQESKATCTIKVRSDLDNHLSHLHYMPKDAQFAVYCHYRPYFISWNPFLLYRVTLYANKNLQLVDSWAGIIKY